MGLVHLYIGFSQLLPSFFIHGKNIVVWLSVINFHIYNHGHNILRIFDVLPNFPFTTSETKPDY